MLRRRIGLRLAALLLIVCPSATWAACSSPSGLEGEILYNHDYQVMQFCNGTLWVSMASGTVSLSESDPQVDTLTASKWCKANAGATAIDCTVTSISLSNDVSGTLQAAQMLALTGDVTNSAGSVTTAIGSGKVTNAMLAGSIAASKLVGTDIATVGTITSGVWNAGGVTSSGALTGTTHIPSGSTAPTYGMYLPAANKLGFATNSTGALYIDSSQNVGIGTASPASKLDVNGTVTATAFAGPGSVPAHFVGAFNLAACPTGWTEYTPARGRFIRGIDNGAGNDPDGTRALGNIQADMFKAHTHAANWRSSSGGTETGDGYALGGVSGTQGGSTGGAETRPKNVALPKRLGITTGIALGGVQGAPLRLEFGPCLEKDGGTDSMDLLEARGEEGFPLFLLMPGEQILFGPRPRSEILLGVKCRLLSGLRVLGQGIGLPVVLRRTAFSSGAGIDFALGAPGLSMLTLILQRPGLRMPVAEAFLQHQSVIGIDAIEQNMEVLVFRVVMRDQERLVLVPAHFAQELQGSRSLLVWRGIVRLRPA